MARNPHDVLATREARAQLPYERYLRLVGGHERVAAALEQQAREAGETLDAEDAVELANSELHAMRRERRDSSSPPHPQGDDAFGVGENH